jgi:hypothetical protein
MKNAIKYGLIIGILSTLWIIAAHKIGYYDDIATGSGADIMWIEFTSLIIPVMGLYLGIKSYRDNLRGGKMEFFEGLMEGFKIMLVGGVITAGFAAIYIQSTGLDQLQRDFMGRMLYAMILGLMFDIAISLILMNKQKHL